MVIGDVDPEYLAETLTEARPGKVRRRQAAAIDKILTNNSSFLEFMKCLRGRG